MAKTLYTTRDDSSLFQFPFSTLGPEVQKMGYKKMRAFGFFFLQGPEIYNSNGRAFLRLLQEKSCVGLRHGTFIGAAAATLLWHITTSQMQRLQQEQPLNSRRLRHCRCNACNVWHEILVPHVAEILQLQ